MNDEEPPVARPDLPERRAAVREPGSTFFRQRCVMVALDVVGSTAAKHLYGEVHANRMISAALTLAEAMFRVGDPGFENTGHSAGDSAFLIKGTNVRAAYEAALQYQSWFKAWYYNRLPLKIAIGLAEFESERDAQGFAHHRGQEVDFLHRVNDCCPSGQVVVTPSVYVALKELGFAGRLVEVREKLKDFPGRVFYESNGDYEIPEDQRQTALVRSGVESTGADRGVLPVAPRISARTRNMLLGGVVVLAWLALIVAIVVT